MRVMPAAPSSSAAASSGSAPTAGATGRPAGLKFFVPGDEASGEDDDDDSGGGDGGDRASADGTPMSDRGPIPIARAPSLKPSWIREYHEKEAKQWEGFDSGADPDETTDEDAAADEAAPEHGE